MIVVVGLSHRTAPLSVRERLAFSKDEILSLLRALRRQPEVGEALLLSTCNRVELVAAASSAATGLDALALVARRALTQRAPTADRHVYQHEGGAAVLHLFRVATSLDSLVVGEPQILGQVKAAYDAARQAETVGPILHRVVTRAIRAAKRARSTTAIGSGQVSVPSVALDLAERIFGSLQGKAALLLGSGKMGESIAHLLHQAGADLRVIGRNSARVSELSQRFGAEGYGWDSLEAALVEADVVVTSTSAPHHVVDHAMVSRARRHRRGRSLFFIDVAVPRDIDPAVNALDGVFLYNVDDLAHVVAGAVADRQREAESAELIVREEADSYERWLGGEQVTPTIRELRRYFEGVFNAEVDRTLRGRLKHLSEAERQAVQCMVDAALKKALHVPSSRLRQLARGEAGDDPALAEQWAQVVQELFPLDAHERRSGASAAPESSAPGGGEPPESMGRVCSRASIAAGSNSR